MRMSLSLCFVALMIRKLLLEAINEGISEVGFLAKL